jgi:hypothetical protein
MKVIEVQWVQSERLKAGGMGIDTEGGVFEPCDDEPWSGIRQCGPNEALEGIYPGPWQKKLGVGERGGID